MFPLYDQNPHRTRPVVTWLLLAVNVLVFLWQWQRTAGFTDEEAIIRLFLTYGATPGLILDALPGLEFDILQTVFTSMFLHGDILHIFSNMLFLFIFGDNVEDRFGHVRYFFTYFVFGVLATAAHIYTSVLADGIGTCTGQVAFQTSVCTPAIGASGAISGVLGAYLVLFPGARIVSVIFLGFFIRLARVPALLFLGFWFAFQLFQGALGLGGNVAIWAHIGGFVVGVLLGGIARALRRPQLR